MRKQNLIGNQYGRLTVISLAPKRPKSPHQYWLCRCNCGKETEIRHTHLTCQTVRSCGCSHFYLGSKHPHWTGFEEIPGTYLCSIRQSATKRNLEFQVNTEDLWNCFLKQNRKCALSGLDLTFNKTQKDTSGTASLDRIDSTKGYTKDNIQWLHKWINNMKSDMTENEFLFYCMKIIKHKGLS